jgi:hypothetical protein
MIRDTVRRAFFPDRSIESRRIASRSNASRCIASLLAATACAIASGFAIAQSCDGLKGARRLESSRYVLAYRTKPAKLAVGKHFVVEMAVCQKDGQAAPEAVRVDGFMPEHNHGMNYTAAVKAGEGGHYLAEGMLFHMPGRWDLIFEVRGGGRTDRMTHTVILQ